MGTRTLWNQPGLDDAANPSNIGDSFKNPVDGYREDEFVLPDRELVHFFDQANLVSSFTTTGKHLPVIDIDLPIRVVPSKTGGHFHLYIEKELEWSTYLGLLEALAAAGIVEWNYVYAAQRANMTFVRTEPEKRPARDSGATPRPYGKF